jgi:hypothetical protein
VKKFLPLLLAASVIVGTSSQAAISYQSVTNPVSGAGMTFNFNKFNPSLGTLNSITFSILSSIDSGSFFVQNNNVGSVLVRTPRDFLTVVDNQASGADYNGNNRTLATTPSTGGAGFSLAGNTSQSFTVTPISLIGVGPVDYDLSAYLAAYTGTGFVSFDAAIAPSVTITGGVVTFDMSGVENSTAMSLTYDYTAAAVPEPSQVAASILLIAGVAGFVIVRRRKAALVS